MEVQGSQRQYHQERRQDERHTHQRGSKRSCTNPSQVHGELRCQRPRRELGEGEAFHVILNRYPLLSLDQVFLHVSRQSDGSSKTQRSQTQEIEQKFAKPRFWSYWFHRRRAGVHVERSFRAGTALPQCPRAALNPVASRIAEWP
jgi:hypothetical protein